MQNIFLWRNKCSGNVKCCYMGLLVTWNLGKGNANTQCPYDSEYTMALQLELPVCNQIATTGTLYCSLKHVSIVFGRTLFSNNVRATVEAETKNGDYFLRFCFDISCWHWCLNNNELIINNLVKYISTIIEAS